MSSEGIKDLPSPSLISSSSLSPLFLRPRSTEPSGLVYFGGGAERSSDSCVARPKPVIFCWKCESSKPCVALRLVPSPTSSCEGMWANCARDISVGDLCGPGLMGVGTGTCRLDVRPWPKKTPWLAGVPCRDPSRPASNNILPCSLPYGGGGARLPVIGASPHFFTFASINTNPLWPKLTCTVHGPLAPTVGKKFCVLSPWATSSSFLPLRVKKTLPVLGR